MDIASIYMKNMLWSLSFVTATQAECVHCSGRENLLFVRDLAPISVFCAGRHLLPLPGEGSCTECMCRELCEGGTEREIFVSFCYLQIQENTAM